VADGRVACRAGADSLLSEVGQTQVLPSEIDIDQKGRMVAD
jgi:hypothetical protein